MSTYLQILKKRNTCIQQFCTHWRLVKNPYLLATPLNLCQNSYWQNMNFVVRWGKAHNHNPLKWTAFSFSESMTSTLAAFNSSSLYFFTFFVANFNVNLIFHFFHMDLKKNLMVLKLWPIWKETPIRKPAFILFIFSACPWIGVNLVQF